MLINKEVIRELIEAQQGRDTKPQTTLLLASMEKLRKENTRLQQLLFKQVFLLKDDVENELLTQIADYTEQISQSEAKMKNMC